MKDLLFEIILLPVILFLSVLLGTFFFWLSDNQKRKKEHNAIIKMAKSVCKNTEYIFSDSIYNDLKQDLYNCLPVHYDYTNSKLLNYFDDIASDLDSISSHIRGFIYSYDKGKIELRKTIYNELLITIPSFTLLLGKDIDHPEKFNTFYNKWNSELFKYHSAITLMGELNSNENIAEFLNSCSNKRIKNIILFDNFCKIFKYSLICLTVILIIIDILYKLKIIK